MGKKSKRKSKKGGRGKCGEARRAHKRAATGKRTQKKRKAMGRALAKIRQFC